MKSVFALQAHSFIAAFKAMLVLTLFISVVYTGAVTAVGLIAFPNQANGSLLMSESGNVIGSQYIGQSFTRHDGTALPQYFQSRPSATTDASGKPLPYNALISSGSNLGPNSKQLLDEIRQRQMIIAQREHVQVKEVPADAVTASASGLDYQISPQYAQIQIKRVSSARHLSQARVRELVEQYTTGRGLGIIADPAVNVVALNAALDRL